MNPSISRLLIALPFSLVLSLGLVLLTWSLNEVSGNFDLFNWGLVYTIIMFSFMCIISIRKIIMSESSDYPQNQLDLILDGILLEPKKYKPALNQYPVEDVEFDYTQVPVESIPSPEIDKSLQF